ncbi:MAG: GNAT family N-acetyltransferase [Dehalococcoidia bacterium]|jgi:RimJ/RimL family protein N-acetyltransferase
MLTTERLIIRQFREDDYQDLYEYLSLNETYRFEPGEPVSPDEAKNICKDRAKGTEFWAATLKENEKLIGHVSFIRTEPELLFTWEIGFIFNPAFQNKGYATEASRALIDYAFSQLSAHRVVGFCSTENIPSWKVLEKCGMRREGMLRQNVFFHNDENGNPVWFDSYAYGIIAEDFL